MPSPVGPHKRHKNFGKKEHEQLQSVAPHERQAMQDPSNQGRRGTVMAGRDVAAGMHQRRMTVMGMAATRRASVKKQIAIAKGRVRNARFSDMVAPQPTHTDAEIAQARDLFYIIDTNNDGNLDFSEFHELLGRLGRDHSYETSVDIAKHLQPTHLGTGGLVPLREFINWYSYAKYDRPTENTVAAKGILERLPVSNNTGARTIKKIDLSKILMDEYDMDVDLDEVLLDSAKIEGDDIDADEFENFLKL